MKLRVTFLPQGSHSPAVPSPPAANISKKTAVPACPPCVSMPMVMSMVMQPRARALILMLTQPLIQPPRLTLVPATATAAFIRFPLPAFIRFPFPEIGAGSVVSEMMDGKISRVPVLCLEKVYKSYSSSGFGGIASQSVEVLNNFFSQPVSGRNAGSSGEIRTREKYCCALYSPLGGYSGGENCICLGNDCKQRRIRKGLGKKMGSSGNNAPAGIVPARTAGSPIHGEQPESIHDA